MMARERVRYERRFRRPRMVACVAVLATLGAIGTPASGQEGGQTVPAGVGFVYSTFGESPDIVALAGGTAEEFCESNPDDPFNGEPGVATQRIREWPDGSIRFTINSRSQALHLYEVDGAAPVWLEETCDAHLSGQSTPEPFASGTARVRSRVTVRPDGVVDVFNSASGEVRGSDGERYRVRGTADLVVVDGAPVGDPPDFVDLRVRRIGN